MADVRLPAMGAAGAENDSGGGGGGAPAWRRDVRVRTTQALTTTGGTVWAAAHRAVDYVSAEAAALGLQRPGARVLELGAGCGQLGLTVALNCPDAAEVCLTERACGGALAHLEANVRENAPLLPAPGAVTTAALDWTHARAYLLARGAGGGAGDDGGDGSGTGLQQQQPNEQQPQQQQPKNEQQQAGGPTDAELADLRRVLRTPWDFIVGSDLVYDVAGAEALPVLLVALLQPREPPPPPAGGGGGGGGAPLDAGAAEAEEDRGGAAAAGSPPPRTCRAPLPPPGGAAVMIYAHTKHRYDAVDVALFENLRRAGLRAEEVAERGREGEAAAAAARSPPPFSELWPELRCAVFRISRAAAA